MIQGLKGVVSVEMDMFFGQAPRRESGFSQNGDPFYIQSLSIIEIPLI